MDQSNENCEKILIRIPIPIRYVVGPAFIVVLLDILPIVTYNKAKKIVVELYKPTKLTNRKAFLGTPQKREVIGLIQWCV